jgi:hypothetical protein
VYLLKNKFEVFDKVIQYKKLIKIKLRKFKFKDLTMVENFKSISLTNIVKKKEFKKTL